MLRDEQHSPLSLTRLSCALPALPSKPAPTSSNAAHAPRVGAQEAKQDVPEFLDDAGGGGYGGGGGGYGGGGYGGRDYRTGAASSRHGSGTPTPGRKGFPSVKHGSARHRRRMAALIHPWQTERASCFF